MVKCLLSSSYRDTLNTLKQHIDDYISFLYSKNGPDTLTYEATPAPTRKNWIFPAKICAGIIKIVLGMSRNWALIIWPEKKT